MGIFSFNQRLPGQVFDAESGLFQNWNREYNPRIGRYMQSDPIGLGGGINTFSYVGGDPLASMDPWGLSALGQAGGVVGGVLGRWGGANAGAIAGGAAGSLILPGPGTAAGATGGAVVGGVAGGRLGNAAGTAAGDWIDNLVFAQNNKQIRKRIEGLQEQIDTHKKKLDQEPDCDASNHWRKEVKVWESEIERLQRRLPGGK